LNAASQPQKEGALIELIRSAHAADATLANAPMLAQAAYAPQFLTPRYLVVLDRAPSASAAAAKMQTLRERGVSDAAVVQSGNEFLVVAGRTPVPQADALRRATAIKRDRIAEPTLAPVQP
jgi:hypothetical protein